MSRYLLIAIALIGCAPQAEPMLQAAPAESQARGSRSDLNGPQKLGTDEFREFFGPSRRTVPGEVRKILGGQEGEPVADPDFSGDIDSDGATPTPPPAETDTGDTGLD